VPDKYASIATLDEELENEKWTERTELITRLGPNISKDLLIFYIVWLVIQISIQMFSVKGRRFLLDFLEFFNLQEEIVFNFVGAPIIL
jgi:hypothetical protein